MRSRQYLAKHQLGRRSVTEPPEPDLELVVVLPSHAEGDITPTLEALWRCHRPSASVEVLIVINAAANAPRETHALNRETADAVHGWTAGHEDSALRFHVLNYPALPPRHAGVGLARKLGMDEAVARLAETVSGRGIIVSLDADCRCAANYLESIHDHFLHHARSPAANIYFEHPLTDNGSAQSGIVEYELYLRYYVRGLRFAGLPYAFHTVGSSMAVRSEAYVAQGGMNRRQAGEDFYFLHKLFPLGGFTEILDTTVYPAARRSHRTPFGTGRYLERAEQGKSLAVYAPQCFADLRCLVARVGDFSVADPYDPSLLDGLPRPIARYLETNQFDQRLHELQRNTASIETFRQRFYRWFNGFHAMKCLNQMSRCDYARIPVEQAAAALLRWERIRAGLGDDIPRSRALLEVYRRLERCRSFQPMDRRPSP